MQYQVPLPALPSSSLRLLYLPLPVATRVLVTVKLLHVARMLNFTMPAATAGTAQRLGKKTPDSQRLKLDWDSRW